MSESNVSNYPPRISIDCFEGPLELLLYLIRAQEVDIWQVSLSEVCDQFIAVLNHSLEMDIEIGGEFLIVASTLIEIKSRRILPGPEEEDEDAGEDPREELLKQVIAFRDSRKRADMLRKLENEAVKTFTRGFYEHFRQKGEKPVPREPYAVFETYQRLLEETLYGHERIITMDQRPAGYYRDNMLKTLSKRKGATFRSLFPANASRTEIVGSFLALLELIKDGLVEFQQSSVFGEIRLSLR
ncbi:MAG: ScpA family protein [Planctomycetota bacterium]|nr:ScpA family protein [Planctomycetota bacterium]